MNFVLDHATSPPENADVPKPEGDEATTKVRKPRGFAAMDRKRVSEIASRGGKAAHAAGTAHQFTADEARDAGRKGGVAPHVRRGRGPRTKVVAPQPSSTESSDAAASS
jgi:general stress protein YciG